MQYFKIYIPILLLTLPGLCQTSQIKLHPFSGTVVLSLDCGFTISKTDYPNAKIGGRIIGGAEYYLQTSSNHIWGIRGFFGGQQINSEEKNKIITIPDIGTDTLPDLIKTDMYLIGISLIYSYSINNKFFPYISLGVSNLWFSPKIENGNRAPYNSANKYKRNSVTYDIDLGIKYGITDNISIKLEGGIHYPNNDNLDDISTGKNKDFYATGIL